MVNDQFMRVPQIPVPVDGKTYFGCCAMCKGRLEKDVQVRLGIDPASKPPVDKANAVMARTASREVLYFENEDSLRSYSRTL